MGKSKSGTNIFSIMFKSLIIYIKNFFPLTGAMLFPVLGQALGLFLIFYPTYLYRQDYLIRLSPEELQQNLAFILLGLLLIVLPGFAVFIKAFWEYMVVMVSLNPMISDMDKKGEHDSLKVYNNSVKLRTGNYVSLLLIISLIWLLVLIFPFLAFPLGMFVSSVFIPLIFYLMITVSLIFSLVLSINLSLSFQIFAFESISPINVVKKSWRLIKGNFWRTFLMGTIVLLITSLVIPVLVNSAIEKSPLISYIIIPFESYINLFSKNPEFIEFLSSIKLTPFELSQTLALSSVGAIITAMMLPLGSACFTFLYFDILSHPGKTKLPAAYESKKHKD